MTVKTWSYQHLFTVQILMILKNESLGLFPFTKTSGNLFQNQYTSMNANKTVVGRYGGGRFGLSVMLLRKKTNSTILYVSSRMQVRETLL